MPKIKYSNNLLRKIQKVKSIILKKQEQDSKDSNFKISNKQI